MRKSAVCWIALSLFCVLPVFAGEVDLSADPQWRALMGEAGCQPAGEAVFLARKPGEKSTCVADCGDGTSVSCLASGTCTAVDTNCAAGVRGYVQCGSNRVYCPVCPPDCDADGWCNPECSSDPDCYTNPCAQYNYGSCTYVLDRQGCCVPEQETPIGSGPPCLQVLCGV